VTTSGWNPFQKLFSSVSDELDRQRGILRAKKLRPKLDSWANALVQIWDDESAELLIRGYASWIRELDIGEGELDADQLSQKQETFLRLRVGDAQLNAFERVRLVLELIVGKFSDYDFLDQLDADLIPRWVALEPERRRLQATPLPKLPPAAKPPELAPGSEAPESPTAGIEPDEHDKSDGAA
jgi:hypothetical protein